MKLFCVVLKQKRIPEPQALQGRHLRECSGEGLDGVVADRVVAAP